LAFASFSMSFRAASVPSHSLPWMLLLMNTGVLYEALIALSLAAADGAFSMRSRIRSCRAVSRADSGAVTVTR
jgi:hypothetical protein